jgi:hypothetical protein
VFNTGTATLNTSGLTVSSGFTILEGLSSAIEAGGSDTFQVQMDTATAGTRGGTVSFTTNDANEGTYNFAIKGAVAGLPEVAVTGNSLDIADGDATPSATDDTFFGTAVLGQSVIHTFTVTNSGTAALTTSTLKLPKGFLLVGPTLPASIAAGGGRQLPGQARYHQGRRL